MRSVKIFSVIVLACLQFTHCTKDEETPILPIHIEPSITHVSEYGNNDGEIFIEVSGGVPPYTYLWSTTANTQSIKNLYAGSYWVQVTDARDSLIKKNFSLIEPDSKKIILNHSVSLPSCSISKDGAIHLKISGGTPPYSIEWDCGHSNENLSDISVGMYIVNVYDNKNQHISDTIIIPEPTVTDIDGNIYGIVKIGNQIWMKENLRVSNCPQGEPITGYDIDNNPENSEFYGKLYSWTTAMNGESDEKSQGICPDGWHIPSDKEWKDLEIYLGMSPSDADLNNVWRGTGIGTAIKAGGSSGLDLPLAGRVSNGVFSLQDSYGYVWSSTESGTSAYRRCIGATASNVGRWNTFPKTTGFSVRCIKTQK